MAEPYLLAPPEAGSQRVAIALLDALSRNDGELEVYCLRRHQITVTGHGEGPPRAARSRSEGVAVRRLAGGEMAVAGCSGRPPVAQLERWLEAAPRLPSPGVAFPRPVAPPPPPAGLFDPRLAGLGRAEASQRLAALLAALRQEAPAAESWRVTECAFTCGWEEVEIANSSGVDLVGRRSFAEVLVEVRVGDGASPGLGAAYLQRNALDRLDFPALGRSAMGLAARSHRAPIPGPGPAAVVFGPQAVASLMEVTLLPCWQGGGPPPPLPPHLTIHDDPHLASGLNSTPFDDEGRPTRRLRLAAGDPRPAAAGGRFRIPPRQTRRDYRAAPRPWPTNLVLEGPRLPAAELLAGAAGGVWIPIVVGACLTSSRRLCGTAFNASRIAGGVLGRPLAPFRFEVTVDDLFAHLDALGEEREPVRPFPWWSPTVVVAPSVRTEGLCIVS